MYVVTVIVVSIGFAMGQQGEPGPPGPSLCKTPTAEAVTELKVGNLSFSRAVSRRIAKIARESKEYAANLNFVRRSTCDCFRPGRGIPAVAFNETSGPPAGDVTPKSPVPPPGLVLIDTCPSVFQWFQFPVSQWYNGEQCFVLQQWQNMRCPYRRCQNIGSCAGVRSTVIPPFPGVDVCRNTNFKFRYYYIWCPNQGLVLRYVRLPQCCSCMYLRCF